MRALLQRVSHGAVTVDGIVVGQIGRGFVLLLGITHSDSETEAAWLANKIAGIRLFDDANGKMNLALQEVDGAVLFISQFTLYRDGRKGKRKTAVLHQCCSS